MRAASKVLLQVVARGRTQGRSTNRGSEVVGDRHVAKVKRREKVDSKGILSNSFLKKGS